MWVGGDGEDVAKTWKERRTRRKEKTWEYWDSAGRRSWRI